MFTASACNLPDVTTMQEHGNEIDDPLLSLLSIARGAPDQQRNDLRSARSQNTDKRKRRLLVSLILFWLPMLLLIWIYSLVCSA